MTSCTLHSPCADRRGRGSTVALVAALCSVAVVGFLAFLVLREDQRGAPALEPTPGPAAERVLEPLPDEAGHPTLDRRATPPGTVRRAAAAEPDAAADPERGAQGPGLTLVGRFVRPDQSPVVLERAEVILLDADSEVHRASVRDSGVVRLEGLAPSRYRVRIETEDRVYREQELDLAPQAWIVERHRQHGGPSWVHEEDLVLWTQGWVAVRVETPDGRPFGALAQELDMKPEPLVSAAFDVRAWHAPAAAGQEAPGVPGLVTFHPAPSYDPRSATDGFAGSLELHAAAPLELGLVLYCVPVRSESLHGADHEVLFRLDALDLAARLATLRLRVLAAEDGAPLAEAAVTLRASSPGHQHAERIERRVAAHGRLELPHIVPGSYELTVTRGASFLPDMLELAAGEVRDLGDLVLPLGRILEIEVIRADGSSTRAFLQVGPHRPGERADRLYPSGRDRHLSSGTPYRLPAPVKPTILRVVGWDTRGTNNLYLEGESANVLLDPDHLPSEPLRLVVHEPKPVSFTLPEGHGFAGACVEVLDELELIVARAGLQGPRSEDVQLVPGAYRARLVGEAGAVLDEMRFEMEDEALEVRWP